MRDVLIVPPKHSWLVTGGRHFRALFRFFERPKVVSADSILGIVPSPNERARLPVSYETTTGARSPSKNDKVKSVRASPPSPFLAQL